MSSFFFASFAFLFSVALIFASFFFASFVFLFSITLIFASSFFGCFGFTLISSFFGCCDLSLVFLNLDFGGNDGCLFSEANLSRNRANCS